MVEKTNKSYFNPKLDDKYDDKDDKFQDEKKLLKLEEILDKLKNAVEHRDNNLERSNQHETSKRNTSNKSNFSNPTTAKAKEDRSDKEFLGNYMNDEHTIPPKNMHLLTDNDTNQSISSQEKFKNLCNLLVDDKNITEFNFIRNPEEKIKLSLYTAFSKKSIDLFINENDPKQFKNQTLFHKINDIHIPKFKFKPSIQQNTDAKPGLNSSFNDANDTNSEKAFFYENSNNNNSENNDNKSVKTNKNNNEQNDQENENEEKKFTDCYFRQETKGYFHMPTLVKIEQKSHIKKEFKKQKTYLGGPSKLFNPFIKKMDKKDDDIFWDPEIDSDTLSYINHNFISIEDIYNGKNLDDKNEKNTNDTIENEEIEPNLIPIKAKEIFFDKDGKKSFNNIFGSNDKQEMEHGDGDKLKEEFKNDNKFIEYIAITPGVEKFEYQMESNVKEEREFTELLKKDFKEKIERALGCELNEFPKNGKFRPKNIERYLRFQRFTKYDVNSKIEITLQPKSAKEKDIINNIIESKSSLDDLNEQDVFQIGKINNVKDKEKDKSFSAIEEKKSYLDEGEDNATHKNLNSFNSEESQKIEKSELNFNINDESQISYSSEKSKSLSNYK